MSIAEIRLRLRIQIVDSLSLCITTSDTPYFLTDQVQELAALSMDPDTFDIKLNGELTHPNYYRLREKRLNEK